MDYEKDILIFSGEGTTGTWEHYAGRPTKKAIARRLEKERANGDRWASAWIHLHDNVYGQLSDSLNMIVDYRSYISIGGKTK